MKKNIRIWNGWRYSRRIIYDTFRKVNISHSNFIKSVLVASWLNGWEGKGGITTKIGIIYYNVIITVFLPTEEKQRRFLYLQEKIEQKEVTTMRTATKWCRLHNIECRTNFHYRRDYSILANLWNFYTYLRFKKEERRETYA